MSFNFFSGFIFIIYLNFIVGVYYIDIMVIVSDYALFNF